MEDNLATRLAQAQDNERAAWAALARNDEEWKRLIVERFGRKAWEELELERKCAR